MRRKYTQMREDAVEYPLDSYNKLSKAQQRIFTFLMKSRGANNQQRIQNVEIADRLDVHAQHVSHDLKAVIDLDMIRRGKYNLIMINPNMWFAGDAPAHNDAVIMWNNL